MATNKDLDRDLEQQLDQIEQDKDFDEEVDLRSARLSEPALGPSDSSDSGSDMPRNMPDTDSDRNNTGERPQVENTGDAPLDDDVEPDEVVPEERAGLAHTPPDPARNGGADERNG